MAEKKPPAPRSVSDSNTKRELLDAYHQLALQLEETRKAQQKPEEKVEERRAEKSVQAAEAAAKEDVPQAISRLRSEIGKSLADVADKLESAVEKYRLVAEAIKAKERELEEIYEIQRSASSLNALLELQARRKREFDEEIAEAKGELEEEIEEKRAAWESEKQAHAEEIKERESQEKRKRDRDKEEYDYAAKREKDLAKQKLEDELAALQREIAAKKQATERDLGDREKALAAREKEFEDLRKRAEAFPKEMDAAIGKAVQDATGRLKQEAASKELLLQKEFAGERNVQAARIEALERAVKEQAAHIEKLQGQIEKSYAQVQDIAVKAIDGSAASKSLAGLQQMLADQSRKSGAEK